MKTLTTFILIGTVDSHDGQFATVELDLNPATNAGPALAVMPVTAFPCKVDEGDTFYVVKLSEQEDAIIICHKEKADENER
jgi:hypothetical protein|tara:strand:+ start:68 stop:310 length:243 start_codon:yes stop_codon:yes gene_type:complete